MSALKPAYETFCQSYVIYPNATEAAREAGYAFEHASQQGYRLLRKAAIARRIAEVRAELAERECLSPDALLTKLEAAFRSALKGGQAVAAARIVEIQAKLAGLLAKPGGETAARAAQDAQAHSATRAAMAVMAKHLGLAAPQFEPAPSAKSQAGRASGRAAA